MASICNDDWASLGVMSGHERKTLRLAVAESEFRHALRLFRDTGGEADLNAAIVEIYLGRMLSFMHDRHEARAEGLRLLAHARDVFGRRADSVSPHYSAQVNLYLAEALIDDGELVLAREPIQACVAFFGDSVESPLQRSVAQVIHGRFLTECGEYDAATHVLEAARTERLRAIGPDHPQTAAVTYRIGLVHLRDNDFARARAVFESILRTEDHGEAVWATLKQLVRMSLALTQLEQGDVAQALPALQASFDHYCANTESARYSISEAEVSLNLGRALLLSGEARRALPLLQRAADAMAMNHPKSPGLASNRGWLGLCCLALGDAPQARALADLARAALHAQPSAGIHYRRSLALLTERLGTDPAPR